ncbi:secreted frizzled-related protein 1 isoform X2 [Hyaena hyaena]|uniref:secreted frizzled-related protein 1 isoform X2 n=1 Tax=Hyaena hyaena TaxID=95912 RepID=UPI001921C670|nr:secreted frizzled-related protein 1 isoform X2 [Hyaena hyaena]
MGSGRGAGGRRWAAPGVLLALAAGLLAAGSASEYDYVSFQSDIGSYQSGRFYTKPPQCVDIPVDLRLCHNVGYKKMVLPNLLEHETMAEVKQQASSWVPLLNKNCHIGTQVFLCSLFAPVCLDRPIYPCRWLCEAVRDSCEPVMQFFGFYWPEMLKCDKFPEGDVCIAMTPPNATEASKPQGKESPSPSGREPSPHSKFLTPETRCPRKKAPKSTVQKAQKGRENAKAQLRLLSWVRRGLKNPLKPNTPRPPPAFLGESRGLGARGRLQS